MAGCCGADGYNHLRHAGASLARDPVDARVVEEIRSGTAAYGGSYAGGRKGIIDSQRDVGGWPLLNSTAPPADSDHDGMPDAWETARGLDPQDPNDGPRLLPGGYTALEHYLNAIVESTYPTVPESEK